VPVSRRAPFVSLMILLQRRYPGLDDPARLIKEGAVLVNGVPAASPRTRVRTEAVIRIRRPRPLRGTIKLAHALTVFGIDVAGAIALDLGAAAGGFTQALLDAGAARVYAVDAGTGQLRGWLRADPRVINLERTNLASLSQHLISEPVNLITMDLSYLAIAEAIGQIDRQMLAPATQLIALVKPTFELHAAVLANQPRQVAAAVEAAARAGRPRMADPWPAAVAHPRSEGSGRNTGPCRIRIAAQQALPRRLKAATSAGSSGHNDLLWRRLLTAGTNG
jgi:predicted rRNA methylase YqxC with S4 and FtsJ domains